MHSHLCVNVPSSVPPTRAMRLLVSFSTSRNVSSGFGACGWRGWCGRRRWRESRGSVDRRRVDGVGGLGGGLRGDGTGGAGTRASPVAGVIDEQLAVGVIV